VLHIGGLQAFQRVLGHCYSLILKAETDGRFQMPYGPNCAWSARHNPQQNSPRIKKRSKLLEPQNNRPTQLVLFKGPVGISGEVPSWASATATATTQSVAAAYKEHLSQAHGWEKDKRKHGYAAGVRPDPLSKLFFLHERQDRRRNRFPLPNSSRT
jgi:hypothetical protein